MSSTVEQESPAAPQLDGDDGFTPDSGINGLLTKIGRLFRENAVALIVGAMLIWLVGGPLIFLVRMSLGTGSPADPGALTFSNFTQIASFPETYPAVLNTIVYSAGVSFVSLFLAVAAAWLIERTDMPGRNLAWVAVLAPLAVPGMLASMSWILLLTPRTGALNILLRALLGVFGIDMEQGPFNIYSLGGMIFVEGVRGTTTLFLMIVGAFRLMDPSLEDAAAMAGASKMSTMRRVTLPLLVPALFAAAVYAFLGNLQDFDTPLVIGLPAGIFILPTLIYFIAYASPIPSWGLAAAYASLFLVVMAVLTYWYYKTVIKKAKKYATVAGKAYRPQRVALGRWRWPAAGMFALFFLISILLPFLILLWTSFHEVYRPPSLSGLSTLTLEKFNEVLSDRRTTTAAVNTVMLAVTTSAVGMSIAFVVSWAVVRLRVRGALLMDAMAFAPNAIPTVAIGIGMIIFYLGPAGAWLRIYGTLTMLVLGMTVNYLAFTTRLGNGAMAQIGSELEEAAWVSGRGKFVTLLRITIPVLMPAFMAGLIWVMAHTSRHLTLALMLGSRQSEVMATRLYLAWTVNADISLAAAIGVLFMLVLMVFTVLARGIITRGFTSE